METVLYAAAKALRDWRRFCRLPAHDRALVLEAAFLVVGIWCTLRMIRYARVQRVLDAYGRAPRTNASTSTPDRIAWAITSIAERLPMHATCLVRALAGRAIARRRGWPAEIRVGVLPPRRSDVRPLDSHAWMEVDGRVVIGDLENLADYAVLSRSASVP